MSEQAFGRYQLKELLGEGGMGQVYRAFDTETDRVVAVKVLPPHLAEDGEFQKRFRREAHTAAALTDPHVIPIHNFGEIDGRLFVDMRLIDGRDLQTLLDAHGGGLSPERAVGYIEQVAEALNAAHQADLVHRDVKPSNILVTGRDFVYLIDFGIARALNDAKLTQTGHAIGTFAYMAPERFGGSHADSRSDVYSLACVLFECLAGQPPYPKVSAEEQIAAHLMAPPPSASAIRADLPPNVDTVIAKGLAKDPKDRYQTVLEFAAAARTALDDPTPEEAEPDEPKPDEELVAASVSTTDNAAQTVSASAGSSGAATKEAPAKRLLPWKRAGSGSESKPKTSVALKTPKQTYEPLDVRIWIALLLVAAAVISVLALVLTTVF